MVTRSLLLPEKIPCALQTSMHLKRDHTVQGQTVSAETVARDKYGRSVAKVKIDNLSVNAAMRRKGYK